MKRPKTKGTPAAPTAPQPAATGIAPLLWHDDFGMVRWTERKFIRGLRVMHYPNSKVEFGQRCQWALEELDWAEDGETVLRMFGRTWFETKQQADAALAQKARELKAAKKAQDAEDARKLSSNEQDLTQARLRVLREQYPDTFEALAKLATVQPGARPEAMRALSHAYAVDLVRLHKPANLEVVSPIKALPMTLLMRIVRACKAKSPFDPVDVEIAARWFAAGYDKMSLAEYTDAINAKTGAKLKPEAMEKRRYKKLGLMTERPTGPASKV